VQVAAFLSSISQESLLLLLHNSATALLLLPFASLPSSKEERKGKPNTIHAN